jgi:hypothetical protein
MNDYLAEALVNIGKNLPVQLRQNRLDRQNEEDRKRQIMSDDVALELAKTNLQSTKDKTTEDQAAKSAIENATSRINRDKQFEDLNALEKQYGMTPGDYNLQSNRETAVEYGIPKFAGSDRTKEFMSTFVEKPEAAEAKGKSEAVVPGQLRKGNLAGLIEDYRRPEMKDFVKKKLEEFKNNTGFDENVFQTKLDAIDAGEGYVVSKFIDEYYSQGQKNNQKVDLENKLIEPRTKTKASTTTAGLQATKDEGAILSETAAERLGDFDASISQMGELLNGLNNPDAPQGPIAQWKKVNPYDWQAQGKQQLVAATKQLIGKALEGGVLRKEDEDKYAKILPTMGDTYESAKLKTEQLSAMLNNAYTAKRSAFKNAGYDVTKFSGSVKVGAKPGLPGNYDPGLAGKEGDAIKERSAWTPDKQKRLEELRRKKAAGELK